MQVDKRYWGEMEGKPVHLYDIIDGNARLSVSDYGALWHSFVIGSEDFVLGYDTPEEYKKQQTFFGAMVGPIADRMAEGSCVLDGKTVQLEKNAGPDSMHSSNIGFHNRIWDAEIIEDGLCFTSLYENDGLPGNIRVCLIYRLAGNTVRIEYSAETDTETALSFTNHSYFNLDGGKNHCRESDNRRCADDRCCGDESVGIYRNRQPRISVGVDGGEKVDSLYPPDLPRRGKTNRSYFRKCKTVDFR